MILKLESTREYNRRILGKRDILLTKHALGTGLIENQPKLNLTVKELLALSNAKEKRS